MAYEDPTRGTCCRVDGPQKLSLEMQLHADWAATITTLVARQARECLQRETCETLIAP